MIFKNGAAVATIKRGKSYRVKILKKGGDCFSDLPKLISVLVKLKQVTYERTRLMIFLGIVGIIKFKMKILILTIFLTLTVYNADCQYLGILEDITWNEDMNGMHHIAKSHDLSIQKSETNDFEIHYRKQFDKFSLGYSFHFDHETNLISKIEISVYKQHHWRYHIKNINARDLLKNKFAIERKIAEKYPMAFVYDIFMHIVAEHGGFISKSEVVIDHGLASFNFDINKEISEPYRNDMIYDLLSNYYTGDNLEHAMEKWRIDILTYNDNTIFDAILENTNWGPDFEIDITSRK